MKAPARRILASQTEVHDASDEELLAAYQHYAGRAVLRFADRLTAQRRVVDALMASSTFRGQLGVPKNWQPAPVGFAECVQAAADRGRYDPAALAREGLPGALEGVTLDPGTNPYPPGSLAHQLYAQPHDPKPCRPPPAARPSPREQPRAQEPKPRARPEACARVALAAAPPLAALRPGSAREAVYRYVATRGSASLPELEAALPGARAHVGKLLATKHLSIQTEDQS